jgi:ribosomal protein S18 acetylase RimI-like enzyme
MYFISKKILMGSSFSSIVSQILPSVLHLGTFKIQRNFSDDVWNKVSNGAINCRVYDKKESVGEFDYRIKTGQIGGIFTEEKYRCRALEQQMLIYMMKDMQDAGAEHIWEVAPDDTVYGRRFYSKLWSFQYKRSRVHPSVTGGGYIMTIPKDLRSLPIIPGIGAYDR